MDVLRKIIGFQIGDKVRLTRAARKRYATPWVDSIDFGVVCYIQYPQYEEVLHIGVVWEGWKHPIAFAYSDLELV